MPLYKVASTNLSELHRQDSYCKLVIADSESNSENKKLRARSVYFELIKSLLYRIREEIDGPSGQLVVPQKIENEIMRDFYD